MAAREALPPARDAVEEPLPRELARGVADSVKEADTEPPTAWTVGKGAQEPSTLPGEAEERAVAEAPPIRDCEARSVLDVKPDLEGLPVREGEEVADWLPEGREERVPPTAWAVGKGAQEPSTPSTLPGVAEGGSEARGEAEVVRETGAVGADEGEAARLSDALTVAVGPPCVPVGHAEGVEEPDLEGDAVTDADAVPARDAATVRVALSAADWDGEKECVALRGSEKDCEPLLGGEGDCEPPTAFADDSVGAALLVKEPPPRSPPGAAATVADTEGDTRGLVRDALVVVEALGEGLLEALAGIDFEPEALANALRLADAHGEALRLGRGDALSLDRVPVTLHERVFAGDSEGVCVAERRADLEKEALVVSERLAGGEAVPLTVARLALAVTDTVEDCEGDAAEERVRVPPMGPLSVG